MVCRQLDTCMWQVIRSLFTPFYIPTQKGYIIIHYCISEYCIYSLAIDHTYILCSGIFCTFSPLPFSLINYIMYIYFFHSPPLPFTSLQLLFSLLRLISLNYTLSPSSLSFLSCRHNIITQCWQQNPEDRPTFFQLADKLQSHLERIKCASVCIDDDLSDIEEEGEFKRGDSNRYWLWGTLMESMNPSDIQHESTYWDTT